MNRSVVGAGVALVGGLGLALVFWLTAPSVEPVEVATRAPVESPEARARRVAQERAREREQDDTLGPPARRQEDQPDVDPELVGMGRKEIENRGRMSRMRTLLQELQAVEGEPVPEGATPAEEDRILAKPIARKMKLLEDMHRDALVQGRGENPVLGARSQLLLAEAYEHTATWLRDRPVPSYLDGEGEAQFLDALEERARVQEDRARDARTAAQEQAAGLPADHPIHSRL